MARSTRVRSGISAAGAQRRPSARRTRAQAMGIVRIVPPPGERATSLFQPTLPRRAPSGASTATPEGDCTHAKTRWQRISPTNGAQWAGQAGVDARVEVASVAQYGE